MQATALHFLVLTVAGWPRRCQLAALEYLRAENQVLGETLLCETLYSAASLCASCLGTSVQGYSGTPAVLEAVRRADECGLEAFEEDVVYIDAAEPFGLRSSDPLELFDGRENIADTEGCVPGR